MIPKRRPVLEGALLAGVLFCAPTLGNSQLVPVKTVPVATGDQFLLFPSTNLAMGGVSLALTDTLGDPFSNPATAVRLKGSVFFGSPTLYSISDRNGSGRTLPVGTFFRSGEWFGGGAVSIQEVKSARRDGQILQRWGWGWVPEPPQLLSEGSARNLYAFGTLGKHFSKAGISVGISGFWADLKAVDGVDLLYARSQEIDQTGSLSDLRLGILKEWEDDRSLEFLLLKTRLRMRHDVTYVEMSWLPTPGFVDPIPQWVTREEENLDHTDTWGAQLAYQRPLNAEGWRMGWSITGNWKDHPKIPNYEIQNIPRDPGNTSAYAVGVGVSKTQGASRFALDLVLEPIRSETWADAAGDTTSVTGEIIPAGEKTVENDFRFLNALVRAGGAWDYRWATFRAGVQLRSISYELDQFNRVEAVRRDQTESWMEWTPSLGVSFNLDGATLHYAARFTSGTGRPGTRWDVQSPNAAMFDSGTDFILAPEGPLTLRDALVTTHQLSVVIPIQ